VPDVLAYVFWHQPSRAADVPEYEQHLAAFHERLRADPPEGFRESVVFRVDVPWLGPGYEDWYLVGDWSALGVLNAAAVDASHKVDHDSVAGEAAKGAGGIYELHAGELALRDAAPGEWSGKPLGEPYRQWEGSLVEGRDPADFALWQRQMVLGPAPEYCLFAATPGHVSRVVPPATNS
jgi:hypothetical protein